MNELKIIEYLQNNIKNKKIIFLLKYSSYILNFPVNIIIFPLLFKYLSFNLISIYSFLAYYEFIVYAIKYYVKRDRPFVKNLSLLKSDVIHKSYSFPSAHSTSSYLIAELLKKKLSTNFVYIFPLVVGISRIFLGVHYPSDVLFGYILGYLFKLQINYFKLF